MAAEELCLKELALVYLDRTGGLHRFINDCICYNDSKQCLAVYRFIIYVNPADVTELDARLGNCILHHPIRAAHLFQSVCFTSIKTLSLIEQLETENQVNVVLKLTHLPPLPNYSFNLCQFPHGYQLLRYYKIEGVVIAMTTVTKYTQGARFLCSESSCPFSTGFQYIRVHTVGATESATVRNDFTCTLCNSALKEDVKFRVLGDKQLVEIIDAAALDVIKGNQVSRSYSRYQSFTVFLRDELPNRMKIGNRYYVIGIPAHVYSGSQLQLCMEANSIQPWFTNGKIYSPFISDNFKCLLSITASSPWRFTAVLANIFAAQIVPPGTYNILKLSLLLSLVQTCENEKQTIECLDLLVVTSDPVTVDRLLTYSLSLVPCGVRHLPSYEMFATVSKDEHGTGTAKVQAGSALLAKGGICYIGELFSYRKDKLDLLQTVLETRSTTVFISGKKFGEDVDQQMSFPIQCNFWALADAESHLRKAMQQEDAVIGSMDISSVPVNLVDGFGLLIYCGESSNHHSPVHLIQHVLSEAMNPSKPLYPALQKFTTQEYQKLLAFARNQQAELTSEAERLIQGYYTASRRVRTDPVHGSKISPTALKALMSLSETHAKLSLRNKVLEQDAVIAVLLYEMSITARHGSSVLCVAPNAVFPFELCDEHSLNQRDIYLAQFHQQLLQFCYTYAPGMSVHFSEE
ncbi:minichromosome maintenance domain-containing protein 2 isoform X1 [Stegostoma tigrinum]|uniref:minichromosome maintenance domain-containing protein 2 isoform X1 n=1 Tax=Stegostoma tigrinum TaxID=3053191 RepID=UPI0028705235|nr:minichromosome maintenance domain-containing protein 2 isoform X1 [Stegostoma tigrinum]